MARTASFISKQSILVEGPRVRRWMLSVIVAGVPLFFLRFTNDPFNVPKLALLAAGVALVLAVRLIEIVQGASTAAMTRLATPAVAVGAPLLIAWAFSSYRYWALFGHYGRFQGLVPYLLVIALGILVADAFADDLRHLAWALTIAGGVAGAYAVLQFIGVDPFTWVQQFGGEATRTSTLGNPNFTAGFLAMVLPVALALWRSGDERAPRAVQAALAIGGGLVLSFSQGGYAAAAAGMAVFLGFTSADRFKWARAASMAVVAGLIALVLGAVGFAMLNPDSEIVPATTAQRALWWRGAVSMVAEHPLVGAGPNSYAIEGNRFRPPEDAANHGLDFSDDTHSVPLALATGAGLLGLAGYLVVAVWTAAKLPSMSGEASLQVGFAAAAVAYFVQSLVSIDEIALRTTFWVVLGGLAASYYAPSPARDARRGAAPSAKSKSRRRRPAPERARLLPLVLVIAVVGLAVVWWSGRFVLSDARVRWGVDSFRAEDPVAGRQDLERAIAFRGDYQYRHLYGFFAGETALEQEEDGGDWLAEARSAFGFLETAPLVPAQVDYARLLTAYSEFDPALEDAAADAHGRLLDLDPFNVATLPDAIEAISSDDRHEEVIRTLEPRISVVETHSPVLWAYLSLAYSETGDDESARRALQRAEAAGITDPVLEEARRAVAGS